MPILVNVMSTACFFFYHAFDSGLELPPGCLYKPKSVHLYKAIDQYLDLKHLEVIICMCIICQSYQILAFMISLGGKNSKWIYLLKHVSFENN